MCSSSFRLKLLLFNLIFVFYQIEIVSANDVTESLCGLTTDELITHYGYEAEVHHVTTQDGYILTIFRCNSKNSLASKKKPVIVQHGLLLSSDDFCVDSPNHGLAYILADAGYDVWLPNSRGNVYSRKHLFKNPNSSFGSFWNFTWYEMGMYDLPAVIDYILQETVLPKLYYIGYSQGTTSIMILLSLKPEYNEKIYVASLMAPVGYVSHSDSIYKLLATIAPILQPLEGWEFLPRNRLLNTLINTVCSVDISLCNILIDIVTGESDNQRNNTMLPAFLCHFPSGSSFKQVLHYSQGTNILYFGEYMTGYRIPEDFPLSRITAPISLHYSTADVLADAKDVELLLPKLRNVVFAQRIDNRNRFNHIDFVWGMYSAPIVYSYILNIFQQFQ